MNTKNLSALPMLNSTCFDGLYFNVVIMTQFTVQ